MTFLELLLHKDELHVLQTLPINDNEKITYIVDTSNDDDKLLSVILP